MIFQKKNLKFSTDDSSGDSFYRRFSVGGCRVFFYHFANQPSPEVKVSGASVTETSSLMFMAFCCRIGPDRGNPLLLC
jgi:hypothetical protein